MKIYKMRVILSIFFVQTLSLNSQCQTIDLAPGSNFGYINFVNIIRDMSMIDTQNTLSVRTFLLNSSINSNGNVFLSQGKIINNGISGLRIIELPTHWDFRQPIFLNREGNRIVYANDENRIFSVYYYDVYDENIVNVYNNKIDFGDPLYSNFTISGNSNTFIYATDYNDTDIYVVDKNNDSFEETYIRSIRGLIEKFYI